jgi:RiboL-PSP-HEPN
MLENLKHAKKIVHRVDARECKNDLQHLKLRSYVLLCHSVIEEYVEDLGLDVALTSRKKFLDEGVITKSLVGLVTAKVLDEVKKEKAKSKISADLVKNLQVFSEESFNQYRIEIMSNHGIKPENLSNVFVPIGFDPQQIDLSLVNALKSLGEKRGGIAHKFAIKQELTLSAFETDLSAITRDLILFDEEACRCLINGMTVTA